MPSSLANRIGCHMKQDKKYNFFAMLHRMCLIERWSLMQCRTQENVCEHSYQVALIVQALYYIRQTDLVVPTQAETKLDLAQLLEMALLHDATEVITGDLPTPVKYYNPELKHAYALVEDIAAKRLLALLPPELQLAYRSAICPPSSSSEERLARLFIKAADKISALIKCLQELALGNAEFKQAEAKTRQTIKSLNLCEADYFVEYFVPAYALSLDDLNGQSLDEESKESSILQDEYKIN